MPDLPTKWSAALVFADVMVLSNTTCLLRTSTYTCIQCGTDLTGLSVPPSDIRDPSILECCLFAQLDQFFTASVGEIASQQGARATVKVSTARLALNES
jgi:hypothetical protein